ncbi:hypothetical protein D6833_01210, partial [Candidatus Parcubacteria bacterium]
IFVQVNQAGQMEHIAYHPQDTQVLNLVPPPAICGPGCALGSRSPPPQQQESPLTFGITGSEGQSGYSSIISQPAVQKLLLDVAHVPRTPEFLDAALKGTGVKRRALEKLRLVRQQDGECVISFPLFTSEDVRKVRAVAERAVRSLVSALTARRSEIDALLKHYGARDVARKTVAYIVLGCFSLDWDGLDLTAEKGYRSVPEVTIGGGKFIPWAEERSDLSLKGIYWGSHNDREGDFCFTSFGDHFSLPRYAFPDVFWRWQLPTHAVSKVSDRLKPAVERAMRQMIRGMIRQVGRIMFALRDGERTLAELTHLVEMDAEEANALLTLLGKLEYVEKHGERFRSQALVLSERDGAMVQQLRRIGWEVIEAWLSANYDDVKAQLSGLTAIRYGVPYSVVFTQIWHYLFGTANRQLVEVGMFVDPYALNRRYKGFIPVVWHKSLGDLR